MRFEERELKPYAEPVPPEELKNGETYFAVPFLDDDGLMPTLEPLVFIGRDLDPGDEGKLYFEDYGSYRGGVRFETASPDDEAIFVSHLVKTYFLNRPRFPSCPGARGPEGKPAGAPQ